jgi:nicotinate dehydrogenase subunit B
VEHETGRVRLGRVVAAVDSGQPINPDGIRNQIEGTMAQAASWTLYEQMQFDRRHITSTDWSGYPILLFPAAPESVEVHVLPRPGLPFLGGRTGADNSGDRQRAARCRGRSAARPATFVRARQSRDRNVIVPMARCGSPAVRCYTSLPNFGPFARCREAGI